jgi:short-subunit dehydrogenase
VGLPLAGATVLLTGASAGIGAATAPVLAARGATVVVTGRRRGRLDALVATLPGTGHAAIAADLAEPGSPEDVVAAAVEAVGPLDVVVHNAGTPMRRHVTGLTVDEVDATLAVNTLAPVRMTLATLPSMVARGRGCQVYVSSLGGRLGIAAESAYCASKFALSGWAEAIAIDLWDSPVEVRLVLPGPIDTEIWDRPGSDRAHYDGPREPPSTVATAIADAIEGDAFEVYSPDILGVVEWKTSNIDAYLAGVAEFARSARP